LKNEIAEPQESESVERTSGAVAEKVMEGGMRRVLLHLLAGALGGFVIWMIAEPSAWLTPDNPLGYDINYTAQSVLGALLGLGIGAALGAAEGWDRGSLRQTWIYAAMGAGIGLMGGFFGIRMGQGVYGPWETFNVHLQTPNPANPLQPVLLPVVFISEVLARSVGWSLIGLLVGGSMGLINFSPRRIKSGLFGGFLGGALGGFFFEIVARSLGVPELSRAIGFTLVGAGTGLGVSLAQQLAKQAWVRVVVGRNEGRDYLLEKEANALGRDEMSDVPLFGDHSVAKSHAFIKRAQGVWFLQDAGSQAGTQVNGRPVREQPLQENDRITIGSFQLIFHQKGGSAIPVPNRDAAPAPSMASPIAASNVCAFCGTPKNPITGACACAPLASPAPSISNGAGALTMTAGSIAFSPSGQIASDAVLSVVAGPYAGQRFTIFGSAQIGRQEDNTIALPADGSVSRRHATLTVVNGGLSIRDEGSSNGTFVNGARVTDAALRLGDEIRVGDTLLRVG
jgi:pSer/pThr/pTyr-binding forkhead associated (FHA) protein